VRKYDDIAQRQHRIGSGFTWRKRWVWFCNGHGRKSVLSSLFAATRLWSGIFTPLNELVDRNIG